MSTSPVDPQSNSEACPTPPTPRPLTVPNVVTRWTLDELRRPSGTPAILTRPSSPVISCLFAVAVVLHREVRDRLVRHVVEHGGRR